MIAGGSRVEAVAVTGDIGEVSAGLHVSQPAKVPAGVG